MRLARVSGVPDLTDGLPGAHRLACSYLHASLLQMGENNVDVTRAEPNVVSGRIFLIRFGGVKSGRPSTAAATVPDRAVDGVTEDRVPFKLARKHSTCSSPERVGLSDVHGVHLRAAPFVVVVQSGSVSPIIDNVMPAPKRRGDGKGLPAIRPRLKGRQSQRTDEKHEEYPPPDREPPPHTTSKIGRSFPPALEGPDGRCDEHGEKNPSKVEARDLPTWIRAPHKPRTSPRGRNGGTNLTSFWTDDTRARQEVPPARPLPEAGCTPGSTEPVPS